jgi:hypothetical protein
MRSRMTVQGYVFRDRCSQEKSVAVKSLAVAEVQV